ncbi:MAG: ATP-grasp domain-containing protein [Candidatus Margulisbacteria bacterium]|nr:ATP-grasp domain-containing protein [Candidatus Margulisiibacteriota bacterium]MBU1022149.1 ATP-grasp domain-containing protein [Candidatus Margulisiibacteriota bacterium]MBU1729412.1 ATP-grasp domain-containing protein [Candidatus Margulisiibacteriota bacterium]MBU1955685.1 ATP-grasp domain-containing protein [Candidatus Margulisiibacteriota bacterium]
MKIGLTYNLKSDAKKMRFARSLPDDAFEEFDSAETINALCRIITDLGHECVKLGFGVEVVEKIFDNEIDFVFNIAEGYFGRSREAQMPAIFEMLRVPYSGPDPLAAALTLDKISAKRIATEVGVNTPDYYVVTDPKEFNFAVLNFPVILKPAFEGSSKGIRLDSKVENIADAKEKAFWLKENYPRSPIVIEKFITGKEITVGVIGNHFPQILGAMEISPRTMKLSDFVYSLEVKRNYTKLVDYICPAGISDTTLKTIEYFVKTLYPALGCRDVSRFDFRIDDSGKPYFLEVNPLPGLNPVSGDMVIMARLLGIEYADLVRRILDAALERCNVN